MKAYTREIKKDPREVLEIGDKVMIKPLEGEEKHFYHSNIQDFSDDAIFIAIPSDDKGIPLPLRQGEKVEVSVVKRSQRLAFVSTVAGRVRQPFIMFKLAFPEKILVTELRRFFRVPVFIPYNGKIVERKVVDGNVVFEVPRVKSLKDILVKGHMHDLSGGGAFITADKKLEIGQHILMRFALPTGKEFNGIPAKVVRIAYIDKASKKEGFGVEFVDISEREREEIIKYCFSRQRELRRAGEL